MTLHIWIYHWVAKKLKFLKYYDHAYDAIMLRVEYEIYWKVISLDYLTVTWSLPMRFLFLYQCEFDRVKSSTYLLLAGQQKLPGCRECDEVSS